MRAGNRVVEDDTPCVQVQACNAPNTAAGAIHVSQAPIPIPPDSDTPILSSSRLLISQCGFFNNLGKVRHVSLLCPCHTVPVCVCVCTMCVSACMLCVCVSARVCSVHVAWQMHHPCTHHTCTHHTCATYAAAFPLCMHMWACADLVPVCLYHHSAGYGTSAHLAGFCNLRAVTVGHEPLMRCVRVLLCVCVCVYVSHAHRRAGP